MKLFLASTSAARKAVLKSAGIIPECCAPDCDEPAEVLRAEQSLRRKLTAAETVELLARLKAHSVIGQLPDRSGLVLGGDSVFMLDFEVLGKPHTADVALRRAQQHRGRTGVLYSGHHLLEVKNGEVVQEISLVDTATVRLAADLTDAELRAYIATGEPLELAGGFAIDGLAGAFIDKIEGTPSCVMGLSLPALRQMVNKLGLNYTELWNA
ncbi:septum formation protein Maf [Canibacter sp. lx-45]|uniref:Maf family protein n=1 Tax=Canibacter zhuwentaonis TaxID=2837491 RepID=UPI001BDD9FC2|nr:septum formation protein Maf [Canibacter zhuwentaonis]